MESDVHLDGVAKLARAIQNKTRNEDFLNDPLIRSVRDKYTHFIEDNQTSKTIMLWLQYMKMVEIALSFLKAERTGDWQLHLDTCRQMLPYFASPGHYHYFKSTYLYLQTMYQLPMTHPNMYEHFQNGLHVIRRSDHFWAGLSTNLVIEQTLMCALKSSGGLTRGSGMTERQKAIWLLSMPVTAEINGAMQEFTGTKYETTDQHKEASEYETTDQHKEASEYETTDQHKEASEYETTDQHKEALEIIQMDSNCYHFYWRETPPVQKKILFACQQEKLLTKWWMFTKHMLLVLGKFRKCVDWTFILTLSRKHLWQLQSELLFQRLIAVYNIDELSTAFGFELHKTDVSF